MDKVIHSNIRLNRFFWIFLFLYSILLFLPELLLVEAPGVRGYIASWIFNCFFGLFISLIVCVVGELLRCVHYSLFCIWHVLFHILLVSYATSELFLISVFNLQWNAFTFQLLNETTSNEIRGFFSTYANTWQFVLILCGVFVLFIIEYYIVKRKWCFSQNGVIKIVTFLLIVISIILFSVEARCFSLNPYANYAKSDKLIRREGLWNLYQSILMFNADKDLLNVCIASQKDLKICSCSYKSPNIVLVIGETYNKHHSGIYGYGLNTTPRCESLNPIVFEDVISVANATTTAFKYFLSFADTSDTLRWCDTPLFPAIFKSVGYNVVFYSNQYVAEGNLNYYDASAGFFNHPSIYSKLFSHRNHQLFDYDMELVNDFKSNIDELKDSLNLMIIHFHGQHSPAIERYPQEYKFFNTVDIHRSDLTIEQKQYIADYDNATLYNDCVVSEIVNLYKDEDAIVIYTADHGEEIYDFRDKAGRFFDYEVGGKDMLRNQLDVPFLIFPSEKYRELHPDIVSSLDSSRHRPFMTDYLPHLMLWLGGINCEWFNEEKCLCSPLYDSCRKRILAGTKICYDDF